MQGLERERMLVKWSTKVSFLGEAVEGLGLRLCLGCASNHAPLASLAQGLRATSNRALPEEAPSCLEDDCLPPAPAPGLLSHCTFWKGPGKAWGPSLWHLILCCPVSVTSGLVAQQNPTSCSPETTPCSRFWEDSKPKVFVLSKMLPLESS